MAEPTETAAQFMDDMVCVLTLLALREPGRSLSFTLDELRGVQGLQMEAENDGKRVVFTVLKREGMQS